MSGYQEFLQKRDALSLKQVRLQIQKSSFVFLGE